MNAESHTSYKPSNSDISITVVAYHDDPLYHVACRIADQLTASSNNLSQISVLVPNPQVKQHLQKHLLNVSKSPALLGPQISTLHTWLNIQCPGGPEIISHYTRELMLIEALQSYPKLVEKRNIWALADSLITLFDEMSARNIQLPDDATDFTEFLALHYQLRDLIPEPLSQEAQLVHTLWQAWHTQQQQEGLHDAQQLHQHKLHASLKQLQHSSQQLFMVGYATLLPAEISWVKTLIKQQRLTLILHGNLDDSGSTDNGQTGNDHEQSKAARPSSQQTLKQLLSALDLPYQQHASAAPDASQFFDAALYSLSNNQQQPDLPFADRARRFARQQPNSPLSDHLAIYAAPDAEHEAHAIDIQIRRWLLAGKQQIGIISEDRRLARRLRALLERAGIELHDQAGWALSTTRAAAALERLLQTVEEDAAQQPLLDLLKSPFFPDVEQTDDKTDEQPGHQPDHQSGETLLETVHSLEKDIIRQENISRGLHRYRQHARYRQRRVTGKINNYNTPLLLLLDRIEQLCQPLSPFLQGSHQPIDILKALNLSLASCGMDHTLTNDDAGQRVIDTLQQLQNALTGRDLKMNWAEFRAWLGRALEQASFIPLAQHQSIQLLTLEQSELVNFDAVILAGADSSQLPGASSSTPFFNDAIRYELKLPTGSERHALRFYHFRRLLEAADSILITYHAESSSDPALPSAWVELINAFHQLAYGDSLPDWELSTLASLDSTYIYDHSAPLPKVSEQPSPTNNPVPDRLSASALQNLIDCPYRFFASHILKLRAPDEVREVMEKSDFGSRVHRILEAFFVDIEHLPGPWQGTLTRSGQQQAITLLNDISLTVFARDLENNSRHRNWLALWKKQIPAFVNWQIKYFEQHHITTLQAEQSLQNTQFSPHTILSGKLDRIDIDSGSETILLDYKTGALPTAKSVLAGEYVQLPFYAMLTESMTGGNHVNEVAYVGLLDKNPTTKHAQIKYQALEGEQLSELVSQSQQRLHEILGALDDGAGLPAWGDDKTCARCDIQGICRKQSWQEGDKKLLYPQ